MAFPIVTVAGAALGLGGEIFKGLGQRAAAAETNAINRAKTKTNRAIAEAEYDIANMQQKAQWFWNQAETAQLRSVEAQNAVDQAEYGSELINNAVRNLEINTGALYDRFVTEENLRGKQVNLSYNYEQAKLADNTNREVSSYMNQINQQAMASRFAVSQAERGAQELQNDLMIREQQEYLEYNVKRLEAIASNANVKARTAVRQGMGATGQRLALEAGQKLGKLYGEMEIKKRDRQNKMTMMSKYMTGELSNQLGQYALQTEETASRLAYTNNRYKADYGLNKDQLKQLTMPSFDLAGRQYKRELQSLQLQTDGQFQAASKDYRQREFMDPLKPIAGMRPSVIGATPVKGPSIGSIVANGLMSGLSGALKGYEGKGVWS